MVELDQASVRLAWSLPCQSAATFERVTLRLGHFDDFKELLRNEHAHRWRSELPEHVKAMRHASWVGSVGLEKAKVADCLRWPDLPLCGS